MCSVFLVSYSCHQGQHEHEENTTLSLEHKAAVGIQIAFRSFMARRRIEIPEPVDIVDRDQESVATSIEVQTGNSVVEAKEFSESFTQHVGGSGQKRWMLGKEMPLRSGLQIGKFQERPKTTQNHASVDIM
ncbi:IQ-domain 33 [Artemisia annua]|uniref:IQ-domain 33 n=1 Tax=Artemisia annua TaxID=35608 RepID=A0A2U1NMN7_ARTAN|nr:IQ-domain 33 [Artemisia annua]